jgi:3-oxoadipate enol-lactonase
METVTHDGRTTAYRQTGEVPRVLYIHGSGATHRLWAHQYGPDGPAPAVAIDLSGHGESEDVSTDPGSVTLDAYARDVTAVARETGADVLVGNSLGGAVALSVALDSEFDPSGLVLAGTGAKLTVLESLREWLDSDFERAIDFLHGPDRLFHDADERIVERSRAAMSETGQAVVRRDFLTCHAFDVRERLDELDVPALALVGEHDQLTPPSYHEYLAEQMPDCGYRELERAAHLTMAEEPVQFNREIGRFLATLDG